MRRAAEAAPAFLYLPDLRRRPATFTLAGDEAHYLIRVVRARESERVRATDGAGLVATLRVEHARGEPELHVEAMREVARPAPARLLCGAPEGERGDWLVEKLAELGVTDLVPVDTDRVSWPAASRGPRWERLAAAALRQSRSAWRLAIHPAAPLEEAVAAASSDVRWLADATGEPAGVATFQPESSLIGAVGPSSGFSDRERELLLAAGFAPVRLGPYRLRTETAAVALASHWAARRPQSCAVSEP